MPGKWKREARGGELTLGLIRRGGTWVGVGGGGEGGRAAGRDSDLGGEGSSYEGGVCPVRTLCYGEALLSCPKNIPISALRGSSCFRILNLTGLLPSHPVR